MQDHGFRGATSPDKLVLLTKIQFRRFRFILRDLRAAQTQTQASQDLCHKCQIPETTLFHGCCLGRRRTRSTTLNTSSWSTSQGFQQMPHLAVGGELHFWLPSQELTSLQEMFLSSMQRFAWMEVEGNDSAGSFRQMPPLWRLTSTWQQSWSRLRYFRQTVTLPMRSPAS